MTNPSLPAEYVRLLDRYVDDLVENENGGARLDDESRAALDSFVAELVRDNAAMARDWNSLRNAHDENVRALQATRADLAACRAELRDEQERHAQLQARCYDQGGGSVFDEVRVRGKERDAALASQERLRAELQYIAQANPAEWVPEMRDQFQLWAQNRARAALASEGGEK